MNENKQTKEVYLGQRSLKFMYLQGHEKIHRKHITGGKKNQHKDFSIFATEIKFSLHFSMNFLK